MPAQIFLGQKQAHIMACCSTIQHSKNEEGLHFSEKLRQEREEFISDSSPYLRTTILALWMHQDWLGSSCMWSKDGKQWEEIIKTHDPTSPSFVYLDPT